MGARDLLASLLGLFNGDMQVSDRNLISDSNKDLWLGTGAALSVTMVYTQAAMTAARCGAGGVGAYNQGLFAPGDGPANSMPGPYSKYGILAITTASTGSLAAHTGPAIQQFVDDVTLLDGRSVTLSVWLRAVTAPITVTQITSSQNFGTGGSPSAAVVTPIAVNWVVPTTWKRFSVRIDLPSAAGKTFGTTNNHFTTFIIETPVGSIYTIHDIKWQVEISSKDSSGDTNGAGGNPTGWEYRGPDREALRTSRYFQYIPGSAAIGGGNYQTGVSSGSYATFQFSWPTMRSTPAMGWGGVFTIFVANVGAVGLSAMAVGAAGPSSGQAVPTFTSSSAGQAVILENSAGSAITLDARP